MIRNFLRDRSGMNGALFFICLLAVLLPCQSLLAQSPTTETSISDDQRAILGQEVDRIFDDKLLIEGYAIKLANSPKDILLAMANDDALNAYKKAAAIRLFREKFGSKVVQSERIIIERVLIRQLEHVNSIYVKIEIMHTLVIMDRYRYFDAMVPVLIQKLDHYDVTVNELAYKALDQILTTVNPRTREARIVFNTLRKTFFLSRKKLLNADPNDPKLKNKILILRWSIKTLGTNELKNLPKEVLSLM